MDKTTWNFRFYKGCEILWNPGMNVWAVSGFAGKPYGNVYTLADGKRLVNELIKVKKGWV